jgi:hypothetical protein
MFKVKGQLTNVRPSKTENPELNTSTSKGMMRINTPGVKLLGFADEDYATIVPAEDEDGTTNLYITKGHKGNDGKDGNAKVNQYGARLSSASETGAGTLQFGSTNAWNELGGDSKVKKIYSISETPVEFEGAAYFKLTFDRSEAKTERKAKEAKSEA